RRRTTVESQEGDESVPPHAGRHGADALPMRVSYNMRIYALIGGVQMGAGHGHGSGLLHSHSHGPDTPIGHAGGRYRMRLAAALVLTAAFFGVECVAGLVSGSLALLSDAGHMGADVVALGAALAATVIATRPDSTGRRTFGSYRVEIFASGLAVLITLGMGVYVLVEAAGRVGSDAAVETGTMLIVGVLGPV